MPSKRGREEVSFCRELARQHNTTTDLVLDLYDAFYDHFFPEVVRVVESVLKDAFVSIQDRIAQMEIGEQLPDVDALMIDAGLDPTVRSAKIRTRTFLKECGLLEYHSPSGERWIKRLTDQSSKTESEPEAEKTEGETEDEIA
jgi:hypothetical protein